ncbi:hypothetical protein BGZ98_004997, partial [Dissophora globulifera]
WIINLRDDDQENGIRRSLLNVDSKSGKTWQDGDDGNEATASAEEGPGNGTITVVDDYTHHATTIAETGPTASDTGN